MYLTEKEEILALKDENKELREQIKRMNDNMNDMWRKILSLQNDSHDHHQGLILKYECVNNMIVKEA